MQQKDMWRKLNTNIWTVLKFICQRNIGSFCCSYSIPPPLPPSLLPPPPGPPILGFIFLLKRFHNASAQQLCHGPFCLLQAKHFCQPCRVLLPGIFNTVTRTNTGEKCGAIHYWWWQKILIGFIVKKYFFFGNTFVQLVQKPVLYLPPLLSPRIRAGSHLPWGHHTTRRLKPGLRSVGPITS